MQRCTCDRTFSSRRALLASGRAVRCALCTCSTRRAPLLSHPQVDEVKNIMVDNIEKVGLGHTASPGSTPCCIGGVASVRCPTPAGMRPACRAAPLHRRPLRCWLGCLFCCPSACFSLMS